MKALVFGTFTVMARTDFRNTQSNIVAAGQRQETKEKIPNTRQHQLFASITPTHHTKVTLAITR
jgi:hypothetical protein